MARMLCIEWGAEMKGQWQSGVRDSKFYIPFQEMTQII